MPTVTAENPHIYREEIERVAGFVRRIHIDLGDGDLSPVKMINPIQAWWPDNLQADIHVMYQKPEEQIETLISLQPDLVIFHVESEGSILELIRELHAVNIKVGVALLASSQPENFADEIGESDHALIFGGRLGYHGGEAYLQLLDKVPRIKEIKPDIEIGWDGGASDKNVQKITSAGVNVVNVGGFIQKADAPQDAYDILMSKIKQ